MFKYTLLLALVWAQEAEEVEEEQDWIGADWALSETTKATWLWCDDETPCAAATHTCVKHMWYNTVNDEYDSGSGCAWLTGCRGD